MTTGRQDGSVLGRQGLLTVTVKPTKIHLFFDKLIFWFLLKFPEEGKISKGNLQPPWEARILEAKTILGKTSKDPLTSKRNGVLA